MLVEKGDEKLVMESLKVQKDVACKSDDLHGYDEFLQQRIIVSLAINALGKKGKGGMMYNNGMLLVCDDQNFGVSKRLKELVCLKLEVNKYMNLAARTTSFHILRISSSCRRIVTVFSRWGRKWMVSYGLENI